MNGNLQLPDLPGSANPSGCFVIDLAAARKSREPAKLVRPRVCLMLALADQYQRELDTGLVKRRSDLALLHGISKPRVTQLLDLHRLHPAILDYIRSLPVGKLLRPTTEKKLRAWVDLPADAQLRRAEEAVQGFAEFQRSRAGTERRRGA